MEPPSFLLAGQYRGNIPQQKRRRIRRWRHPPRRRMYRMRTPRLRQHRRAGQRIWQKAYRILHLKQARQ